MDEEWFYLQDLPPDFDKNSAAYDVAVARKHLYGCIADGDPDYTVRAIDALIDAKLRERSERK